MAVAHDALQDRTFAFNTLIVIPILPILMWFELQLHYKTSMWIHHQAHSVKFACIIRKWCPFQYPCDHGNEKKGSACNWGAHAFFGICDRITSSSLSILWSQNNPNILKHWRWFNSMSVRVPICVIHDTIKRWIFAFQLKYSASRIPIEMGWDKDNWIFRNYSSPCCWRLITAIS